VYPENIFTLDARENIFLESVATAQNLSTQQTYIEIRGLFESLIDVLEEKSVKYADLKYALIPRSDRTEVALAFDTSQIKSAVYSAEVFKHILPLLEKDSICSCLCGDYVGSNEHELFLREIFMKEICEVNAATYQNSTQFFIVYFNNLSDRQFTALLQGLSPYKAFTGYFDITYSSPIKTLLSSILVRLFVKSKMNILLSSEGNEDANQTMYPLEEFGYKCLGIDDLIYGLFLSYKIEREVFPGFETDGTFSINAISQNVFDIRDFTLLIEEPKLKYLKENKLDNFERANFHRLTRNELEEIIRNKLNENYIYNLSYSAQFNTAKFNILLEVPRSDKERPMKMLAALEYIENKKQLRLITLF
jgi:hypothetical protein